jgi:hypothetical protein
MKAVPDFKAKTIITFLYHNVSLGSTIRCTTSAALLNRNQVLIHVFWRTGGLHGCRLAGSPLALPKALSLPNNNELASSYH